MVQRDAEMIYARRLLSAAFTPAAPVQRKDLFAGRNNQISDVLGAVSQVGQHVVIFGERGVGKTSLASLIGEFWNEVAKDADDLIAPRVNCEASDSFGTVWIKVVDEIGLIYDKRRLDRNAGPQSRLDARVQLSTGNATAHDIRVFLELSEKKFIIILDEFDRIEDADATVRFADTIKTLSDHATQATLVIVGVADSIDDLIEEHRSIDRALVQVMMPRMSIDELEEIVSQGLSQASMTISDDALRHIARLSQGLPRYAHLFGLSSGESALNDGRFDITESDVTAALESVLARTEESIRSAYHRATTSPRRESLYRYVLLAAAVTPVDDLGYFAPADVREPFSAIMTRRYDVPAFSRHLNDFCEESRGAVLGPIGPDRRRRFRFSDPLLKAYVALRGLQEGLINRDMIPSY